MPHLPQRLKGLALPVVTRIAPRIYQRHKVRAIRNVMHEQEIQLLPLLCSEDKVSLDVGASAGTYTLRLMALSREVVAFEPRPDAAERLIQLLKSTDGRASVEAVALSDGTGTGRLRVLNLEPGRSTLEEGNVLRVNVGNAVTEVAVPIRALDDYHYTDVGFVKIDVEGHEGAVLRGGRGTLLDNQPTVLIESEDRHRSHAVRDVDELFADLGYVGYFLLEGRLRSMTEFEPVEHQDPRNIGGVGQDFRRFGVYVNNFVYVPQNRAARLEQDVAKAFPEGVPEISARLQSRQQHAVSGMRN